LNLMSNAIKFTEKGSVTLAGRIVSHKNGKAAIRFSVSDTGIGMTEEQINRLYEPFMQADESTSRQFGGTGLGLNISKSIIEMMGGVLTIESTPGEGSTFSFTIQFDSVQPVLKRKFPLPRSHGNFRMLIVEDSPLLLSSLAMMVHSLSLQTELSSGWTDALERLEQDQPAVHAVLLDMEAADMYGEETWLQMKETAARLEVLTIVYTTLAGRDALLQLPEPQRPDAILVKPICRLQLYHTIAALQERFGAVSDGFASLPVPEADPLRFDGHVLLVEDQPINQTVARAMLETLGISVVVANHGLEALQLLQEQPFDLVLMDIHMPEMDGLATTERIRQDDKYAQLPVIALTADITESQRVQGRRAGMNDMLNKPLEPELLAAVLSKWLPLQQDAFAQSDPSLEAPDSGDLANISDAAGINFQEALRRLDGKREILIKLLLLFREQHASTAKKLMALINENRQSEAKRLSHSLQGAAGNLGMKKIFQASGLLEAALEESEPDIAWLLTLCGELDIHLNEAFHSIETLDAC
jgi:two-component system sensor histidine kinase/response regulator